MEFTEILLHYLLKVLFQLTSTAIFNPQGISFVPFAGVFARSSRVSAVIRQ